MHRRSLDRPRSLVIIASGMLVALVSMLNPAGALANNYTGLLNGGTASASASGNAYGANSVVTQQSWSAPSGVQLGGFAYTSASFNAANADATGGLSAGFKGSGGSAPTDLNFPWTTDCSISEATPRTWVNQRRPGGERDHWSPWPGSRRLQYHWQHKRLELRQRRGRVRQHRDRSSDVLSDADALNLVCA